MAKISVGSIATGRPTEPSGSLPVSFSIENLIRTDKGNVIEFEGASPLSNPTFTNVVLVLDANQNITSITVSAGNRQFMGANFSITEISIPLATFLAQRANIMPLLLAGDDNIYGTGFNNIINGGAGNDSIFGGAGQDSLTGGAGNDRLDGGTGSDVLIGGDGNDVLLPGATFIQTGSDKVDGGAGTDTISFIDYTSGVNINLSAGSASGVQDNPLSQIQTRVEILNVENAIGGNGDDILIGNAGANVLTGGAGNDTFIGDAGADVFDGGLGNDTADYTLSTTAITVNLTTGVAPDGDRFISIENVTGSLLNDVMTGSSGDNVFNGRAGNDQIFGLAGNDTLVGGEGNDTLDGGSGTDILVGGNGNDILLPGTTFVQTGLDQVDGGAGTDTISFAGKVTGVLVDLSLGIASDSPINNFGQVQTRVTILNVENATGGNGDDVLTGNNGANTLTGGTGNDTLNGGGGNDTLSGGDGNDVISDGAGRDFSFGGNGDDVFLPGSTVIQDGLDQIDGGAGIDTISFAGKTSGFSVDLTAGLATDLPLTAPDAFSTRVIIFNVENVIGGSGDDVLIGNAGVNVLTSGAGNDRLFGLAGDDTLNGQAGDDTLFGGLGNDVLGGGFGNDGLFGEAGNDQIYGGEGNDYIEGGEGNDVLWGQLGNDQIIAGAGNDFAVLGEGDDFFRLGLGDDRLRFDYGNGRDTVADFNLGNDVIDFTFTDMTRDVLIANTVETSQGVLITLGSGSILLAGLTINQLDFAGSSDFIFA